MTVFFISDLHLRHDKPFIWKERGYSNIEEHDHDLKLKWHDTISKRDVIYVLGDVAWNKEALKDFGTWRGIKYLVRGNHDRLSTHVYLNHFNQILGTIKYEAKHDSKREKFWISHVPIHPQELFGIRNIHGHLHATELDDDRYINVGVDKCNGTPIPIEEIME